MKWLSVHRSRCLGKCLSLWSPAGGRREERERAMRRGMRLLKKGKRAWDCGRITWKKINWSGLIKASLKVSNRKIVFLIIAFTNDSSGGKDQEDLKKGSTKQCNGVGGHASGKRLSTDDTDSDSDSKPGWCPILYQCGHYQTCLYYFYAALSCGSIVIFKMCQYYRVNTTTCDNTPYNSHNNYIVYISCGTELVMLRTTIYCYLKHWKQSTW